MKKIIVNSEEFGIEENKAQQIAEQFKPMLDKMAKLEKAANEIFKLNPEDEGTSGKAKELRLEYVKIRTGTAKIHKEQKAFYLAAGRYIDGWKNAQIFASEGVEKRLLEIEKYAEIKEAERREKLQEERELEVKKYLSEHDLVPTHLGDMDDTTWGIYIDGAKKRYEDLKELQRIAEEKKKQDELRLKLHMSRKEQLIPFWNFIKEDVRTCVDFGELSECDFNIILDEAKRLKEEEIKKKKEIQERLELERSERAKAERELKKIQEEEARKKAEEEAKLEAELKKGDAAKVKDLINDIEALKTKYSFKSKKNKQLYLNLASILDEAIESIKN